MTAQGGVEHPDTRQTSSRSGAYVRFGGNYHNLSVAWQYSWVGRRF